MTGARLAFSSVLPPWDLPQARLSAAMLPHLREHGLVHTCVENVYRVRAGLCDEPELLPLADLPDLLVKDAVDLPVYLVGDHPLHLHQLRYLRMCPGLLLLTAAELPRLREASSVTVGGHRASLLPDVEPGADPITGLLSSSFGIAVPDASIAEGLRKRGVEVPLFVVPGLAGEDGDPEMVARSIAEAAADLGDVPGEARLRIADPEDCPAVAAVVVTYNSREVVDPCLRSLLDQDYPNLEVIVVDNASGDGTAEHVSEVFPSIRVLGTGGNLGFAGGNNYAFARSNADYFVLLNQDATARRDLVSELVRVAGLHDSVAAVGAKMLMERSPTILNSTGTEINEGGWAWDRRIGERDDDGSPLPVEVFGASGGALLLRRSALQDVGAFDEKLFMYYEDTDLCWRLRLAGHRVYHAPLAVVLHAFHGDGAGAPGRAERRRFLSERNRLQTLIKNCDFENLRRVWPRIRAHDKDRLRWLQKAVQDGYNPDYYGTIAREIRRARRWNLLHLPGLWLRRRRVQKLVRVPVDEIRRFVAPGVHQGVPRGDYESSHDRFSATPRAEIRMGESDDGCLGAGWHALEDPPHSDVPYRWTSGRAWFYLQPGKDASQVVLSLASPMEPHEVELFAEDLSLGTARIQGESREYAFPLPDSVPRDALLELRIDSETARPIDRGIGDDRRELGVHATKLGAR